LSWEMFTVTSAATCCCAAVLPPVVLSCCWGTRSCTFPNTIWCYSLDIAYSL